MICNVWYTLPPLCYLHVVQGVFSGARQLVCVGECGRYTDGSIAAGIGPFERGSWQGDNQVRSWTWGWHSVFVKPQLSRNPGDGEAMAPKRVWAVEEEHKSTTKNKYGVCIVVVDVDVVVVVNILSVLGCGRPGIWIRAGERDFCLLQNVQTCSGAHPVPCSVSTGQHICAIFDVVSALCPAVLGFKSRFGDRQNW